MNAQAAQKLRAAAPFLLTDAAQKQSENLPLAWQTALSILDILQDGEWHTSVEIAEELGKSQSHIKSILQQVKEPWELVTSRHYGFMLPNKNSVIVV